jgi:hypothetical protein
MVESSRKTKAAIACQRGGSQTAFTAGAPRRILRDRESDQEFQLAAQPEQDAVWRIPEFPDDGQPSDERTGLTPTRPR